VQRWCAATRTALMTGRYTYNTGMMQYHLQNTSVLITALD
jgi:arylsulfatase A-like enzyme